MKKFNKFISLILGMIIFVSVIGFNYNVDAATTTTRPKVSAHAYVIMDANSGEILYSKDKNKKIYPASTTKLMTALVAIENCSLSKKIKVKQSVLNKIPWDATSAGLKAGYSYTLEELLNMLLIYSAADAADMIADAVGGKSKFVKLMNEKAKLLGMTGTYFDNPVGMDWHDSPNIYSTATDIAKLTRYAMTNSTIRKIVSKPYYTIKNYDKGSSKTLNNSNKFLRDQWYPKNSYKIIGTKTGTTDLAGYVLTTTATDNNGREVICAFFGNSTRVKMYEDIESLLTYTFNNYRNGKIYLEKGFYDTRYLSSKDVIQKYINSGIVSINSESKFGVDEKVSRKEFIITANKILKSSYKNTSSSKEMTVLDVAKLFKNFNKKGISNRLKSKYKYKNKFSRRVSNVDLNVLVNLYELKVLPRNYSYNERVRITKEEMIIILDNLSKLK